MQVHERMREQDGRAPVLLVLSLVYRRLSMSVYSEVSLVYLNFRSIPHIHALPIGLSTFGIINKHISDNIYSRSLLVDVHQLDEVTFASLFTLAVEVSA